MRILAPAKINLGLDVLGKRSDGYHDVDMVMQTIDFYDSITINKCENKGINLRCVPSPGCSVEDNIAYKATQEFFNYTGITEAGVDIYIEKRIPVCAGLAGGSSDAAAVIVGLNEIFKTNLNCEEIAKIGEKLGKDVPFCVMGGTMRAQGTGTKLSRVTELPNCYIVVIKPDFSTSTKEAYDSLERQKYSSTQRIDKLISELNRGSLKGIGQSMFNSFMEVQKNPEILNIVDKMIENGAVGSCMSGSGPSVFGIFEKRESAIKALEILRKEYDLGFVCSPVNIGVKVV